MKKTKIITLRLSQESFENMEIAVDHINKNTFGIKINRQLFLEKAIVNFSQEVLKHGATISK